MGKTLDWSKIAKANITEGYREAAGIPTFREAMAKAINQEKAQKQAEAERAALEPVLRNALLNAMLSKSEIIVKKPIQNPTETLGGLTKSADDDDDGFYGASKEQPSQSTSFEVVMETIPVGTKLVYKTWCKSLGQWIFKGDTGAEYAIYDKNVITFNEQFIQNPGLYGLLYNTNLTDVLKDC